jgi:hypothetical protein
LSSPKSTVAVPYSAELIRPASVLPARGLIRTASQTLQAPLPSAAPAGA